MNTITTVEQRLISPVGECGQWKCRKDLIADAVDLFLCDPGADNWKVETRQVRVKSLVWTVAGWMERKRKRKTP